MPRQFIARGPLQPGHRFESVQRQVGRIDEILAGMHLAFLAREVPSPVERLKCLPDLRRRLGRSRPNEGGDFRGQIVKQRDLMPVWRDRKRNGVTAIDERVEFGGAFENVGGDTRCRPVPPGNQILARRRFHGRGPVRRVHVACPASDARECD